MDTHHDNDDVNNNGVTQSLLSCIICVHSVRRVSTGIAAWSRVQLSPPREAGVCSGNMMKGPTQLLATAALLNCCSAEQHCLQDLLRPLISCCW
jgi:hypothetical protein